MTKPLRLPREDGEACQRLAAGKLPPPQGQKGQGRGGIAGRSILEPGGHDLASDDGELENILLNIMN